MHKLNCKTPIKGPASLILALALNACNSEPPKTYAPNGSALYQRATICAAPELVEPLIGATERWAAADSRISMKVVQSDDDLNATDPEGCDAKAFIHDAPEGELAEGGYGLIVVTPGALSSPDLPDILAHEAGHLLLGNDHNPDERSVMYWASLAADQVITPDDLARLPRPKKAP